MILRADQISGGYGSTAVLHGLDLTVGRGERRALIGRNGAGKTTLLRTIMGLIPLREGELHYDDHRLSRIKSHRRAGLGIGYVPQGRQIFPRLSVMENLRVAGIGSGARDHKATLAEILLEFPMLVDKADAPGGSLSGGQQQVLALGRALMVRPKLLLLDEPTEGVQPSIRDQIAEHVVRIADRNGMAVLVVEQNLDFAAAIADQCSVMSRGQVVANLPTHDLLTDRELQHRHLGV